MDGNKLVFIHDVKFEGKHSIEWNDVEEYLKQFIGESYVIKDRNDMIYIGTDFPDEYAHSEYTTSIKGANAKAKANAAQGMPELIALDEEGKKQFWEENLHRRERATRRNV